MSSFWYLASDLFEKFCWFLLTLPTSFSAIFLFPAIVVALGNFFSKKARLLFFLVSFLVVVGGFFVFNTNSPTLLVFAGLALFNIIVSLPVFLVAYKVSKRVGKRKVVVFLLILALFASQTRRVIKLGSKFYLLRVNPGEKNFKAEVISSAKKHLVLPSNAKVEIEPLSKEGLLFINYYSDLSARAEWEDDFARYVISYIPRTIYENIPSPNSRQPIKARRVPILYLSVEPKRVSLGDMRSKVRSPNCLSPSDINLLQTILKRVILPSGRVWQEYASYMQECRLYYSSEEQKYHIYLGRNTITVEFFQID